MQKTPFAIIAAGVLSLAVTGLEPIHAQDPPLQVPKPGMPAPITTENPPPTAQRAPAAPWIPLKVTLVISRFAGEKKVSSLPYTLFVTANDNKRTSLRMGVDAPIIKGGGGLQYRNIGTNIDCTAMSVERIPDGRFRLSLIVNDTSVQFDPKQTATATGMIPAGGFAEAPAFRAFTADFAIVLRDGQTAQYTTATDPVSGETMKIDATLSVLK